ncbi:MAG: F0F1 ATP synthase subunit alpha, partial [Methylococcaceae bacterium]
AFAQFASDLDESTRKQIERGQRVTELMKQNQYSPMSVAQMAVSLFAANEGFLDSIAVNKVLDFESALHLYMKSEQSELMNNINATGDFSNEISNGLRTAIETFVKTHSW